ncbi:MAG: acetylglutamate kinase [Wenzhouxiangellaceae bacterium]|nr:acetylglutamate kinase [Wenzhouxiangellaceae bacterium]MBS3746521.1 acetylglutamate kinase [Wenzhouxiangellaceae bacterium]MBS3822729.1 acetylglutamate kinase [Wenzhouxiangellaceae bacterium]
MTEVRPIVTELLGQLGSSREARQYLEQFSRVNESRFAVVKVGGGVLAEGLDALVAALAFLHRLGLYPIVLHGAGPQLDQALADAGIETLKRDGLRVTSEEVMAIARPVIYRENARLVDALEHHGVRARGLLHGVFECNFADRERLGLVGEVADVRLDAVRGAVETGALPVVACLGESRSGQVMNINADIATRELVWATKPYKVIFLTPTGGLLDENGRIMSAISLTNDYEGLMAQSWVHSGMQLKLAQIRDMLEPLPASASVSITSAEKLTRELFTHTGAGTLVRKGERIEWFEAVPEARRAALEALLENAFDRRLRSDWLERRPLRGLLMAESGRAAALILEGADGVPYLDKIVVTPEARGEGLGAALWQALRARCPAMYWRARINNPIAGWYFQQAETSHRRDHWVVYTIGIDDYAQMARLVTDAAARDSGWQQEPG